MNALLMQLSKDLRGALRSGLFEKARSLVQNLDIENIPLDELEALKLRSVAAEVCDYWGNFAKAKLLVAQAAETCQAELIGILSGERLPGDRYKLEQQVWILLQHGMCYYREDSFDRARELFLISDQAAQNCVVTDKYPAWSLRARTQYSLGLVCREELKADKACEYFTQSAEYALNSLESKGKEFSNLKYLPMARSLGMGLAFLHHLAGRPDLAIPLLMSARAMLPPEESLISCHVDLIHALVKGASNQHATTEINEENFERLRNCYKQFKRLGHSLYAARAASSLAFAHLQRARPDESRPLTAAGAQELQAAQEYAHDVQHYFREFGNLRFKLYQLLIQSHIHRKADRLQDAEDDAGKGLEIASDNRPVFLELKLARGEARSRNGKKERAIEDFEEGRRLAKDAKMVHLQSTFLLHLCILKARYGDTRVATQYWAEFTDLRLPVKTRSIRILEMQAQQILNEVNSDLILRLLDDSLDPKEEEKKFRRFLIEWARRQKPASDKEAAALLGISRQTLYNWLQP